MRVSRRSAVDPFIVMDVMEAAAEAEAEGESIIHMEAGQPGAPAPAPARAALAAAMAEGRPLGYTLAPGLPKLRARIAGLYDEWYGIDLDPGRVIVTAGSTGAFLLAFTALFDAGARVALGEPGYPSYRQILSALDLAPVGLRTGPEGRYQPEPRHLDAGLDGLIVASPGNPSGTMLGRDRLAALIEACRARDIAFISDEIYHGIQHDGRAVSALEISDEVYVINSFSKYFCMTGWRVGWMVVPKDHVRVVERLAQNLFICPPHASQVAALAAFEGRGELEANLATYARNRRLMLEGLPRAGFTRFAPPDGAFYVYADVSGITDDSAALAAEMLEEARVAVTPGLDFDPARGHRMLRFSYAADTPHVAEGLRRLRDWAARRGLSAAG